MTHEQLNYKFNNLSNKNQNKILWEALSIMNQHNGRTEWACIILAMGYQYDYEKEKYIKINK